MTAKRSARTQRPKAEWHKFDIDPRVRARRHVNPDGSLGGWVATTAFVGPEVFIAPGASVYGRGCIEGSARILDEAEVRDTARVRGEAEISGHASITGNAIVQGRARIHGVFLTPIAVIGGDARIEKSIHYMQGFLGDIMCRWTAFRGTHAVHWLSIDETTRTIRDWRTDLAAGVGHGPAWLNGLASILRYIEAQECMRDW